MNSLISSFKYLYFIERRFQLLRLYSDKLYNDYFIRVIELNLTIT